MDTKKHICTHTHGAHKNTHSKRETETEIDTETQRENNVGQKILSIFNLYVYVVYVNTEFHVG